MEHDKQSQDVPAGTPVVGVSDPTFNVEDTSNPHVEPPAPVNEAPKGVDGSGRYSAYDRTFAKYVGGVHDSKAKARKAAEDKGSTDFEIVEV